jgi:hypothetical protein
MAAKRKTKKKAGAGGQGKRLTPEQREAIANEPSTMTLAALAEKYGASVPTIIRYRKGGKGKGRSTTAPKAERQPKQASGTGITGVQVLVDDPDYIVIKVSKKSLLKDALGKMFG